jgi:NarL family two-component system response regulator LiaR
LAIRVLITDDHGVVRQGLRMFLSLDPDIQVVGEAQDGREALAMARELKPDVVLMDLLMPVMDGLESTKAIRTELPEVEVIALTSVLEGASVTGAIRAGAIGYLLKDTDAEGLHQAIRGAAEGGVHLSPEAAARLMREVRAPENPEALGDRETEVLRLLARGKTNKQIASELYMEEHTVKAHVSSILMKLGVQSRTQAALHAVRAGLVSVEELGEESW